MIEIQKHIEMLGHRVEDLITGTKGVATSVCFDLYGCIQVAVNPGNDKEGQQVDSRWFDIGRLKITSKSRVMELPNFDFGPVAEGKKGPAEKPCRD